MGTAAPSTQQSVVRCLEAGLGNSEPYKGQLTEVSNNKTDAVVELQFGK